MKNRNLIKVGFLSVLLGASLVMGSCGKDDETAPDNGGQQNPSGQTTPGKPSDADKVSALTCTVAEFAEKYQTLKQGEPVTVTLTDVSDANIAKVSEILKKMNAAPLSKAASDVQYFIKLVLESVDNALKTIPADAFKGVEVLREVIIPACVEAIQSDAFAECVNLAIVKIQGENTKVDEKAFENTNPEIKIEQTEKEVVTPEVKLLSPADIVDYVNASDEEIVTLNMALETYDHTEVLMAIDKITDKKVKLMIPNGLKELTLLEEKLPMNAFNYPLFPEPKALKEVVIPEGVTVIGKLAFGHCNDLASVTIPSSVTEIGAFAFGGCSSLTSITLPDGVTEIGEDAFYECSSLTSIALPDGVTAIEAWAFGGCSSLTSITLPEGVTEIGNGAFSHCSSLTSITLPEGVTAIGGSAFSGCSSLTSIALPEGVTAIGNSAFYGCSSLTSIALPDGVTAIEAWAFYGCSSLTSITLPEGVTEIGYYAFGRCSSLASITIPEGVTAIGDDAFGKCDNLTIYCSQAIYDQYYGQYYGQYLQLVVKE